MKFYRCTNSMFWAILLVLSGILFQGCNTKQSDHRVLKLGHGLGEDHPVHQALLFMGEELVKNSNGKMSLQIFANSQLGSEKQVLELIQIGSLHITKVSGYTMENFSPQIKSLGYPFIFRDRQHRFQVYDSDLGQELLDGGEKYWLKGLSYFDAGFRSFYTLDTPIKTPQDLEGLKIRVMQSPTAIEMVKQIGGSPTPISWGELYTSLQQGVVEGAENNLPSFHTSKHYEICNFYTLDEHTAVPDLIVIGTRIWNDLNSEERQWLMKAVGDASKYQRELWKAAENEALETIKSAGIQIIYPDKEAFSAKTQTMIEDLKEEDPEIYDLVKRIQNLK